MRPRAGDIRFYITPVGGDDLGAPQSNETAGRVVPPYAIPRWNGRVRPPFQI